MPQQCSAVVTGFKLMAMRQVCSKKLPDLTRKEVKSRLTVKKYERPVAHKCPIIHEVLRLLQLTVQF
jgi:hypothetical protein